MDITYKSNILKQHGMAVEVTEESKVIAIDKFTGDRDDVTDLNKTELYSFLGY